MYGLVKGTYLISGVALYSGFDVAPFFDKLPHSVLAGLVEYNNIII